MGFKLHLDEFNLLRIDEIKNFINAANKISLRELKLFDLLVDEERNTAMRHGIYMFFDADGHCLYIGMCSSSHFAHRIGGHFGMSPKYGMNTFLKRIVNKFHLTQDYSSYVNTLPKIADYGMLIISTNGKSKGFISALEKQFHRIFEPELNFPKGYPSTYKSPLDGRQNFLSSITE